MNMDPIDALQDFYHECRDALPSSPSKKRESGYLGWIVGAALGVLLAAGVALAPVQPNQNNVDRAAAALAHHWSPTSETVAAHASLDEQQWRAES